MKIKFWGVRGSIPTPGQNTVRYGGNTPCLEVRPDDDTLLIIDAGTGIAQLGYELMQTCNSIKAHILFSHTHWDHIQGFPFFRPAAYEGNEFTIIGCKQNGFSLREILSEQMKSMYFPLQFDELKAKIEFMNIEEGSFSIGDTHIESMYLNHPGHTLGYKITHKGKSVAYISDNEPFNRDHTHLFNNKFEKNIAERLNKVHGNPNSRVIAFVRDVDVLIHDSMYTPAEYRDKKLWGHSDYLFALHVGIEARARKIILFHHSQDHSDDMIDEIVQCCRKELESREHKAECIAAAEGLVIEV